MRTFTYLLLASIFILHGCKNRDINEGEEFRPREVNEDFEDFHFNSITYDEVEYLITERDNNHPHEGFGFMAFRANRLMDKQDSILAHLQAISEMQGLIYARLYNVSLAKSDSVYVESFNYYLNQIKGDKEAGSKNDD
ncbi:MAG: hypothetical protein AAF551_01475 [Bacteroidota bacterium]